MRAHLGYLVSRYPAISHTFILREVLELRRVGFQIDVASINGLDRLPEDLTAEEREEARHVFFVKAAGIRAALRAHCSVAVRRPSSYFYGMWFAIRLGGTDVGKIIMNLLYFVEAVLVGCWMEQKNLCHLHVHFATPAATVGLILTKVFPFTFSITVHGPDEFYEVRGYLLEEKIAAAAFICSIGLYARSQLMKLCGAEHWPKIETTPLGVDPDRFLPQPIRSIGSIFEVICVGRLVAAKGQHVLLAAIHKLRDRGRSIRLRLVGDGPERASLEQAARRLGIQDSVIFEGSVNQDQIRALFARADVFALASFAEGIPVVLMEAMAMEIPCVTTWITGVPELIRDSVDGLLVAPSDDLAMADAIARLMDDSELRRRLGAAGRRRVIDKYNLRPNVGRLAEVFDEYLGNPRLEAVA